MKISLIYDVENTFLKVLSKGEKKKVPQPCLNMVSEGAFLKC